MNSLISYGYTLKLASRKGNQIFSPDKITRLESKSNYTNIFFTDRNPILSSRVLKRFEEALIPYGFVRVHHSHLVNRKFIDHLSENLGKAAIVMNDLTTVDISKRRKKEVFSILREGAGDNQS